MEQEYDKLLSKIVEKSKKSKDEIEKIVEEKSKNLAVKVSKVGVLHIIANELGIDAFDRIPDTLKVKDIQDGMRNIECFGRIERVYDVREFATGKVGSILLSDETGMIRVVFWNEKADLLQEFNKGDILHIKSAYARKNLNRVELQISRYSEVIINPEGVVVNEMEYVKKKISEISEKDSFVEIIAPIIQVYDLKILEKCPKCRKRLENGVCPEHGEVEPSILYIFSVVLDDSTGNIRCTFFNNLVEKLIEDPMQYKDNPIEFSVKRREFVAKLIKVKAKVNYNQSFDRLETIARDFTFDVTPEEEKMFLDGDTNTNSKKEEPKTDIDADLDDLDEEDSEEIDTNDDEGEIKNLDENEDDDDDVLDDIDSLMED